MGETLAWAFPLGKIRLWVTCGDRFGLTAGASIGMISLSLASLPSAKQKKKKEP